MIIFKVPTWIICSKIGLFLVTSRNVSVAFVIFEQYSPYIKNGSRNSRNTWLNLYFGIGDMASLSFSTNRSWISASSFKNRKQIKHIAFKKLQFNLNTYLNLWKYTTDFVSGQKLFHWQHEFITERIQHL